LSCGELRSVPAGAEALPRHRGLGGSAARGGCLTLPLLLSNFPQVIDFAAVLGGTGTRVVPGRSCCGPYRPAAARRGEALPRNALRARDGSGCPFDSTLVPKLLLGNPPPEALLPEVPRGHAKPDRGPPGHAKQSFVGCVPKGTLGTSPSGTSSSSLPPSYKSYRKSPKTWARWAMCASGGRAAKTGCRGRASAPGVQASARPLLGQDAGSSGVDKRRRATTASPVSSSHRLVGAGAAAGVRASKEMRATSTLDWAELVSSPQNRKLGMA
jgi:hypothetical protein